MIFKAAYLKNTENISFCETNKNRIFNDYKEEAKSLFQSDVLEEVVSLLDRLKDDLEQIR